MSNYNLLFMLKRINLPKKFQLSKSSPNNQLLISFMAHKHKIFGFFFLMLEKSDENFKKQLG